MRHYDVIILGAGGAGMMCATEAGRRGRRVLLVDHSRKLGGKILISGGGRCNFTNVGASPANYVSRNPHFCKSALSRFRPQDFIRRVEAHGIPYHEKKLGQLFCDDTAQRIVDLLRSDCEEAGAEFALGATIEGVERVDPAEAAHEGARKDPAGGARFRVRTSRGAYSCESLVVATGGLSIPKIGATGFGYDLARKFGLAVVETAPALDGFTFSPEDAQAYGDLAGIAIDCTMTCNGKTFRENVLFTHAGLSGPAALQAALHWYPGDIVVIDLLPETDAPAWLLARKKEGSKAHVKNLLGTLLPARFAERWCERHLGQRQMIQDLQDKALEALGRGLKEWRFEPSGTVGYSKAEVTRGGVDTDELSSKTMEARKVPGLYFIGEVVDVTGWLGGYNFQWAWASGWAAGQAV